MPNPSGLCNAPGCGEPLDNHAIKGITSNGTIILGDHGPLPRNYWVTQDKKKEKQE